MEVQFWTTADGVLHREDGPALIDRYGNQSWFRDGEYHRDDGPASIFEDGTQIWCKNDKIHNEYGPAVIWPDGKVAWYINNKLYYTFPDWLNATKIPIEEKAFLKLQYE